MKAVLTVLSYLLIGHQILADPPKSLVKIIPLPQAEDGTDMTGRIGKSSALLPSELVSDVSLSSRNPKFLNLSLAATQAGEAAKIIQIQFRKPVDAARVRDVLIRSSTPLDIYYDLRILPRWKVSLKISNTNIIPESAIRIFPTKSDFISHEFIDENAIGDEYRQLSVGTMVRYGLTTLALRLDFQNGELGPLVFIDFENEEDTLYAFKIIEGTIRHRIYFNLTNDLKLIPRGDIFSLPFSIMRFEAVESNSLECLAVIQKLNGTKLKNF